MEAVSEDAGVANNNPKPSNVAPSTQQPSGNYDNNTSKPKPTVTAVSNQSHGNSGTTKYQKPRKLSGPNNQVPKDLLSNWKNKFEGQQTEIFEEEEEEEEEMAQAGN